MTDDLVEAIAEAAVEFELCPAGVATFLEALGLPTTHRVSMAVTMDASIEVDVPLNFDRDEFDDGHIDALLRQSIVDKLDDMGGTLLDHDALHLVVRVT